MTGTLGIAFENAITISFNVSLFTVGSFKLFPKILQLLFLRFTYWQIGFSWFNI